MLKNRRILSTTYRTRTGIFLKKYVKKKLQKIKRRFFRKKELPAKLSLEPWNLRNFFS